MAGSRAKDQTLLNPISILMRLTSDPTQPATGLDPADITLEIAKNGTSPFATPVGTITEEIGNGWYAFQPDAADLDTVGELLINATEATCIPSQRVVDVILDNQYTVSLARVMGLVGDNVKRDGQIYENGNITHCDIWVYDSAANAVTNNHVTGLLFAYTFDAAYTAGQMTGQGSVRVDA